jgi:hypothetical protein
MATTLFVLTPGSAEFPSTNAPQPVPVHTTERRMALAYDAATQETAMWTVVAPQGVATPLTAVLSFVMASATSNAIVMEVLVEAITDADAAPDLDAATSYDTANTSASTTVPATAGLLKQVSVTLTNGDSLAAADLARIAIRRAPANAGDTAAGDLYLLAAEIRGA